MAKKNDYQKGRLGLYIQNVVDMVKQDPTLLDNTNQIASNLLARAPELTNKDTCANCGASMKAISYYFDSKDAELLVRIAREVREKMKLTSLSLFDANQTYTRGDDKGITRLNGMAIELYYFGLLDKVKVSLPNGRGRMIIDTWRITQRGWLALAGVPVKKHVKVWKNGIDDTFPEVTTIGDTLSKSGYEGYVEEDWYDFYSSKVVDK